MSDHSPVPAPPDTIEIDVGTGGTTVGTQTVTPDANETRINPKAIGPVREFKFVKQVGTHRQTIDDIEKALIPFGTFSLTIENTGTTSRWCKGTLELNGYANRSSRNWPSNMDTPSTGTGHTEFKYYKDGTWTTVPQAEFVSVQIKIVQPDQT